MKLVSFLLVAGADAGAAPAMGGALPFDVLASPSSTWWNVGSAFIYIMLIAGACTDNPSDVGGALTFYANAHPAWANWPFGSAY